MQNTTESREHLHWNCLTELHYSYVMCVSLLNQCVCTKMKKRRFEQKAAIARDDIASVFYVRNIAVRVAILCPY